MDCSVLRHPIEPLLLAAAMAFAMPAGAQAPAPVESAPTESAPAPVESAPVETAPVESAPAPTEPAPAEAAPAAPVPEMPAPVEPPSSEPPPEEAVEERTAVSSGAAFDPSVPAETRISATASAILGHVVDASSGEPIIEAEVFVQQADVRLRTYTDLDGNFAIEVPPGLWAVSAHADFYSNARHRPLRVRTGQRVQATLRLRQEQDDHLVFEVVEVADRRSDAVLNQDRMNATTSQDTIGGAQMARTGSSNAARAVSRVVGASLEGNTLIVRGLGDRYTNVLMNGVFLPGTDPDRNGVQLDVIPAAVIANISVIKSFQPDVPANWAGGLMVIESQSMPQRFEFRASTSLGFNSNATFRNNLDNPFGRAGDALGFGARARALPNAVPDAYVLAFTTYPDGHQLTQAEASAVGASFRTGWQPTRNRDMPSGTLQLSLGDTRTLRGGRRVGYLTGYSYSRSSQVRRSPSTLVNYIDAVTGGAVLSSAYQSETAIDEVLSTAFATASLRYAESGDVRLLAMFTQHASDETRLQRGSEQDNNFNVERWQFQYVQRSVLFLQLVGEQRQIPWWTDERARLRYSVYFAQSHRDEPNTRQVRYGDAIDDPSDVPFLQDTANGSDILALDLVQRDGGGYAHVHLPLWAEGHAEIGFDARASSRTSSFRDFHWATGAGDPTFLAQNADLVLSGSQLAPNGPVLFRERTLAVNQYDGSSRWFGGFATFDLHLTDWMRFAGGIRLESMYRAVDLTSDIVSLPPLPAGTPDHVERTTLDYLPAAAFIFSPNDSMNIRASYGLTVVHPTFREFAPTIYVDFARRRQISGYANLVRTQIHNADLRWEWLSGANGLLSLTAFYKRFVNPIERVNTSVASRDLSYRNAVGGVNYGVELEARMSLGQWDQRSNALDWFSLNGNASFIYSRVEVDAATATAQPSRTRAMYYQSPYVVNMSLGFDEPDSGLSLTLAYNVIGPRITEIGSRNSAGVTPNVVEQPFHQLDLIGGYKISDHWRLSFAIRNILNAQRQLRQGPVIIEQYRPGADVGIGISFVN